jgi:hypothetical protein
MPSPGVQFQSEHKPALDVGGSLIGRMGRDQRIIDDLNRFERLCTETADDTAIPERVAASSCQAAWKPTRASSNVSAVPPR